jgi:SpoVK/Ycf46/Vps4 family AAA+-type ATPase
VGESEASIRGLFREGESTYSVSRYTVRIDSNDGTQHFPIARRKACKIPSKCSVIFFDEIDALGRSRVDEEGAASQAAGDNSSRRVLAELLIQMTGLMQDNEEEFSDEESLDDYCGDSLNDVSLSLDGKDDHQAVGTPSRDKPDIKSKARVIVVAATNRPEDCDPALLRRFAVRVLVALPTKRDRKKIISRLLLDVNHSITKSQLDALACSTEGWSGSDLESMTREAVMAPVRETLRAAAILKRRASKNQQSGANSSEEKNGNIDLIRDSLLIGFRNLRPVSSRDFEDGIAFFLGDSESAFGHFGGGSGHAHYDSSDSSEDEEENNS